MPPRQFIAGLLGAGMVPRILLVTWLVLLYSLAGRLTLGAWPLGRPVGVTFVAEPSRSR
jgi:hypothetical protein